MRKSRAVLILATIGAVVLAGATSASAVTLTGTWNNTTFNSSGPVTFNIDVSGSVLSISADFGGNVFGGVDPPAISFTAPFNPSGTTPISLTGHPVFGNVTGSVQPNGAFNLSADPPGSFITSATVTGTFTQSTLTATYTVNFPDGLPANGTISATPEPATALLLGLGLAALIRRRCSLPDV